MNTSESQNPAHTSRPFGYWLKAADRLMAAEFATAFEGEHATRRDWRLLNIVDGTVSAHRPLNDHKLHRLVERGWVARDGDGWTLTDDGRAAKDRLGAIVDGIRSKVTDAVSAEEMATTLAALEKIARAFGWDEETPLPRGRRHGFGGRGHGRRQGFPRGFGRDTHDGECRRERGHGRRHGFDSRHGFGPRGHASHERGEHEHAAHERGHHGPQRVVRLTQHAYERGFDAGFSRGRDA